jgi:hypothetical protein
MEAIVCWRFKYVKNYDPSDGELENATQIMLPMLKLHTYFGFYALLLLS